MHLITSFGTVFKRYSLWKGVAHNDPERKYCACYSMNISLWEGVVVWKCRFLGGLSLHLRHLIG